MSQTMREQYRKSERFGIFLSQLYIYWARIAASVTGNVCFCLMFKQLENAV